MGAIGIFLLGLAVGTFAVAFAALSTIRRLPLRLILRLHGEAPDAFLELVDKRKEFKGKCTALMEQGSRLKELTARIEKVRSSPSMKEFLEACSKITRAPGSDGERARIYDLLGIETKSVLAFWIDSWVNSGDWMWCINVSAGTEEEAEETFQLAYKLQHMRWRAQEAELAKELVRTRREAVSLALELNLEFDRWPHELKIEETAPALLEERLAAFDRYHAKAQGIVATTEVRRERLKKLRVRVQGINAEAREIEQGLIDEEPGDGPQRLKGGVSTGD